ncbi:MAG: phosphopantetheine-binding protein [Veillonellaceae bacterium]|nr:phosphopantetheine-binding protein [Veillonellaceae bacterium]
MLERLAIILNDIREEKDEDRLEKITENMSLRKDIGLDSLDLALLTAKLEDEFDVDVFEAGIVDSVADILALVEKK